VARVLLGSLYASLRDELFGDFGFSLYWTLCDCELGASHQAGVNGDMRNASIRKPGPQVCLARDLDSADEN
jgi:hypothetical protein